jgi:ankyrin repeat protein
MKLKALSKLAIVLISIFCFAQARGQDPLSSRFAAALLSDDAAAAKQIIADGLEPNYQYEVAPHLSFSLLSLSIFLNADHVRDQLLTSGADPQANDADALFAGISMLDAPGLTLLMKTRKPTEENLKRLLRILASGVDLEQSKGLRDFIKGQLLGKAPDTSSPRWSPHPYFANSDDDPELQICNLIMDAGADSADLQSLLRASIERGDVLLMLMLDARKVRSPDVEDPKVNSLVAAARFGNQTGVEKLIEIGTNLSKPDTNDNFAIPEALEHGYELITTKLLKAGADEKQRGPKQRSALAIVVRDQRAELFELFMSRAGSLSEIDGASDWPLREAVRVGWEDAVKRLIAAGADPNLQDQAGRTALHYFRVDDQKSLRELTSRHLNSVHLLLAAGFDLGRLDKEGTSVLNSALQDPIDFEFLDSLSLGSLVLDDRTISSGMEDPKLLRWLLRHGLSPSAKVYDRPIIDLAAGEAYRNTAPLTALLQAGAPLPSKPSPEYLVTKAAEADDAELIGALLSHGVSPNAGDFSTSASEIALRHGNAAALKALFDAGADLYQADSYGRTMLHRLVEDNIKQGIGSKQQGAVAVLIAHGFAPGTPDKQGRTALDLAVADDRSARALAHAYGLAAVRDTALHRAVRNGDLIELATLARANNVNGADGLDRSPLTLALQLDNVSGATALLSANATVTRRARNAAQLADTFYASDARLAVAFQVPLLREQILYLDANDARNQPTISLGQFAQNDIKIPDLVWQLECRACRKVVYKLQGNQRFNLHPVASERFDEPNRTIFSIKQENIYPIVIGSDPPLLVMLEVFKIGGQAVIPACTFDFKTSPTCFPSVEVTNVTEPTTLQIDTNKLDPHIRNGLIKAWLPITVKVQQGATNTDIEPGKSAQFDRSLGELKIVVGPETWPTFSYQVDVRLESGPKVESSNDFLLPARMATYARIAAYKEELDQLTSGANIGPSGAIKAKSLSASIHLLSATAVSRQYVQNVMQLLTRSARDIAFADDRLHELTSTLIASNSFTAEQIDLIIAQLDELKDKISKDDGQDLDGIKATLKRLREAKSSEDRNLQLLAEGFRSNLATLIAEYQGLVLEAAQYYSAEELSGRHDLSDDVKKRLQAKIKAWEVSIPNAAMGGQGKQLRAVFGIPDPL